MGGNTILSVPRLDGLLVDMVNDSIEEDYNITCEEDSNSRCDFSTPQTHAINDGSCVIINSMIDGCFRIITEGYTILHFMVYKSLCFL